MKRVFLIVLDSLGVGSLPDYEQYDSAYSNTLGNVCKHNDYKFDGLRQLGLFNIETVDGRESVEAPEATYGRLMCASKGKDTTVGHWEMAGQLIETPFPTYPNGFPQELISKYEELTGRKVICNLPYSGTKVLDDYGKEQMETGNLIVYTSGDSVFQVAAHEEVVPVEELYRYCDMAREMLTGEHAVGRVIARPFVGEPGAFVRTSNRHDYSLVPEYNMLNKIEDAGLDSIGIGKIYDIFAGSGITRTIKTAGNTDGIAKFLDAMKEDFHGLCFLNLVDFDMAYGHRNDVAGYGKALDEFDNSLEAIKSLLKEEDMLIITADHGCDPCAPGTDHSREYVPYLMYKKGGVAESIGTKESFTYVADRVLEHLEVK